MADDSAEKVAIGVIGQPDCKVAERARSYLMRAIASAILIVAAAYPHSQTQALDEVIARVNGDPITRAEYLVRLDEYKDDLTRKLSGRDKTEADVDAELERAKPELLDTMIDELLLEQKARQLGYEAESERERRALAGTIGCQAPRKSDGESKRGAISVSSYDDLRNSRSWLRDYLVIKEVLVPIYNTITVQERKEFYDRNQAEFMTPARVTLSEIFLQCDYCASTEIERRAKRVVRQLRNGLSFTEAVYNYTSPNRASYLSAGKLGSFKMYEINRITAGAISSLEPGGISDPIKLEEGYQILRLDARDDPKLLSFSNPEVQERISRTLTVEKAEAAKNAYIARLREGAIISVLSTL